MIPREHLKFYLALAVVIWSLLLIANGVPVSLPLLKPFSIVAGVLSAFAVAVDRWLWRWRVFQPLLRIPDAQGTWRGEIRSDWKDAAGCSIPAIESYLVVRQTLSSISLTLLTNESSSRWLSGAVEKQADGTAALVAGVYENTPRQSVRERSAMHYGGLVVKLIGAPVQALTGGYWTDRKTTGELDFSQRVSSLCDSFDQAKVVWHQTGPR